MLSHKIYVGRFPNPSHVCAHYTPFAEGSVNQKMIPVIPRLYSSSHYSEELSNAAQSQHQDRSIAVSIYHVAATGAWRLWRTIILLTLNRQLIAFKRSYQAYTGIVLNICFKLVAVMAALCHNNTGSHLIIKNGYEVENVLTWVKEYSEEGILPFSSHQLYFVLKPIWLCFFV